MKSRSSFNVRITIAVIVALAMATIALHSLVYLSIQPDSLSAAMPPAVTFSKLK
jgi:hypothetical protein